MFSHRRKRIILCPLPSWICPHCEPISCPWRWEGVFSEIKNTSVSSFFSINIPFVFLYVVSESRKICPSKIDAHHPYKIVMCHIFKIIYSFTVVNLFSSYNWMLNQCRINVHVTALYTQSLASYGPLYRDSSNPVFKILLVAKKMSWLPLIESKFTMNCFTLF